VAVAIYFSAASTLWLPIQVDIDQVCVTPVSASQAVTATVYGYCPT
jgi:hypothetical protein